MGCSSSSEAPTTTQHPSSISPSPKPKPSANINFSQDDRDSDTNNVQSVQSVYSKDILEKARINWNELLFDTSKKDTVLGYGVFGVVLRATWNTKDGKSLDVAVKLFIQQTNSLPEEEFFKMCSAAYDEVEVMRRAENSIGSADSIVKAYGLLMGPLPAPLAAVLDLQKEGISLSGVGIVMRNEAGGTLTNLIYSKKKAVTLYEKVRILSQVAKALSDLHAAGIVHADIKPANILLSGDEPPIIRLADFGLSIIHARNIHSSVMKSTLAMTTQTQGTPVYYAPEMLFNPFGGNGGDGDGQPVAKPSRKTDLYAFALLCWQTLAQKHLFPDITTESVLATMIHKGYRPPLEDLPPQTPQNIIDMISTCWDKDRNKRRTASECHIILSHCLSEVPTGGGTAGSRDEFTPQQLLWSDLIIDVGRPDRAIIGTGTFGVVVRGTLKGQNGEPNKDCAVKIFIQEYYDDVSPADEYQRICKRAIQEARLILRAEKYFVKANMIDNVIRCHGVVIDALPQDLLSMLEQHQNSQEFEYSGVATVMRNESGGSLSGLLFPSQRSARKRTVIPMVDKVRIICGIARALAGLHAVGIVHADLKLENVLLSGDNPPEVRIADFGSSLFGPRPTSGLGKSSLAMTTHIMGSPVYNAPEILFNPYDHQTTTAKPSRKTDMYDNIIVFFTLIFIPLILY